MHDYIENFQPDQPEPSLHGLVAWLEAEVVMRGPRTGYSFYNLRGDCLYAQYGLSLWPDLDSWEAADRVVAALHNQLGADKSGTQNGTQSVTMWGKFNSWAKSWEVAAATPYTLGAALTRARVAIAEQEAVRQAEIDVFLHQVRSCKNVAPRREEDVASRDDVLVFIQQVRALPRRTS